MEILAGTRTRVGVALAMIVLAAAAGATAITQPHWLTALKVLTGLGSGVGIIGRVDDHWTPRTRWTVLGAAVPIAAALGLVGRMVAHGLLLRGG